MNTLIKQADGKIVYLPTGYDGVCHSCNSPVSYQEKIVVKIIKETDAVVLFECLDDMVCPHCLKPIISILIYKSLEVSQELKVK